MAINLIQLKYNYEDYEAIFIYKTAHSQTQISSQKMSTSNFSISNKNKCTKNINDDLKLEINETKTLPHSES